MQQNSLSPSADEFRLVPDAVNDLLDVKRALPVHSDPVDIQDLVPLVDLPVKVCPATRKDLCHQATAPRALGSRYHTVNQSHSERI